jgi:BMFP domain-containing protein YqiC
MDETVEKEIRRLKNDLMKQKEDVEDIQALVNREIDREFQTEALDLAERDLEPFVEKSLTDIKENLVLKAESSTLKSHRKIFGRPVLFLKRTFMTWADIYFKMILDKQNRYNRNSFDLLKVVLLRSRWSKEKLKDLEERLAEYEESLVVMINKVEDLQARLEKENGPAAKK